MFRGQQSSTGTGFLLEGRLGPGSAALSCSNCQQYQAMPGHARGNLVNEMAAVDQHVVEQSVYQCLPTRYECIDLSAHVGPSSTKLTSP